MLGHTVENGAITVQCVKDINRVIDRGRSSQQSMDLQPH